MIVRASSVLLNSKMNDSAFDYLKILRQAQWQFPDEFPHLNHHALQWLTEQGRFHAVNEHCQHFSVEVVRNEASPAYHVTGGNGAS